MAVIGLFLILLSFNVGAGYDLGCLGLPQMNLQLFEEIRQVVEEEDPDAIVVTANPTDACSLSYLKRVFSGDHSDGDFLAPVNFRYNGGTYGYMCPNGQPSAGDANRCPAVDYNVGILTAAKTLLRPSPDGQGIVLGLVNEDLCIGKWGQRIDLNMCKGQLKETERHQVSIPFSAIEDAQGKDVNLPCPRSNCRGIVFRGHEWRDSLLTITTQEDGSQVVRLVVNTTSNSGIAFEQGDNKRFRSCRRPRSAR